ncbi:MAG: molybdenum cofactor guanylyltransferase [Candidatus Atribacteria bacterium]|nr:molybdenum cofactor guanylyltransferase [Candidatus Atribacteria bacterium]
MNKKNITPVTVILLAGGESKRIGLNMDKGCLKLMGINLIDRVISNITSMNTLIEKDILIIGPKKRFPYFDKVVEDIFPYKGPLGGIYSGLRFSRTFYNLVLGYDMPFIKSRLIEYMIQNINDHDIVIPTHSHGLMEPLCAIYSKNCLEIMEKNIKNGNLSVRSIFPFLKTRMIEEFEIRKYDPELLSFFNINYRSDFKKAEELDQERGKQRC